MEGGINQTSALSKLVDFSILPSGGLLTSCLYPLLSSVRLSLYYSIIMVPKKQTQGSAHYVTLLS